MSAKIFYNPFANGGEKEAVPEEIASDGSVSYKQGYSADYSRKLGVDPLAKNIERLKFNQLMYDVTTALRELQSGSPRPYDSELATAIGGYPKWSAVTSGGNIYDSLDDGNTAPLSDGSKWRARVLYQIASQAEAEAGHDGTKIITPERLAQYAAANITPTLDKKYDKTGGTVSGDVNVTGSGTFGGQVNSRQSAGGEQITADAVAGNVYVTALTGRGSAVPKFIRMFAGGSGGFTSNLDYVFKGETVDTDALLTISNSSGNLTVKGSGTFGGNVLSNGQLMRLHSGSAEAKVMALNNAGGVALTMAVNGDYGLSLWGGANGEGFKRYALNFKAADDSATFAGSGTFGGRVQSNSSLWVYRDAVGGNAADGPFVALVNAARDTGSLWQMGTNGSMQLFTQRKDAFGWQNAASFGTGGSGKDTMLYGALGVAGTGAFGGDVRINANPNVEAKFQAWNNHGAIGLVNASTGKRGLASWRGDGSWGNWVMDIQYDANGTATGVGLLPAWLSASPAADAAGTEVTTAAWVRNMATFGGALTGGTGYDGGRGYDAASVRAVSTSAFAGVGFRIRNGGASPEGAALVYVAGGAVGAGQFEFTKGPNVDDRAIVNAATPPADASMHELTTAAWVLERLRGGVMLTSPQDVIAHRDFFIEYTNDTNHVLRVCVSGMIDVPSSGQNTLTMLVNGVRVWGHGYNNPGTGFSFTVDVPVGYTYQLGERSMFSNGRRETWVEYRAPSSV